jgi:putative ABC transport system permease protein
LATGNGAETAAYLLPPGVPANLDGRATLVKAREGRFGDGGADEVVDVLAVDPATFADAAFWDESFADRPLAALLAPLAAPRQDGPIPAIAIGELPDRGELSFPQLGQPPEEIELTGRARAFPAMGWTTPMLVVSADHLPGVFAKQAPFLWTSGTADEVEAGRQPGQRLIWATTLDAQVDTSVFQPVIWIFRYVQALGVLVAVLAAATLLAYLGASAPARDLATGLLRRMGMGLPRQWWAVACELGLLALMAGLTGVLGGWLAVRALRQLADAAPAVPPAGLLRFPVSTVAVAALVAVVVIAVGATVAISRAARRNLAEVLRGDV